LVIPCLIAPRVIFGALLAASLPEKGFRIFVSNAQKSFQRFMNRFMNLLVAVPQETSFAAACMGSGNFNERIHGSS